MLALMASDGSTATVNKREDSCFKKVGDGDSKHGETLSYSSIPWLPEDIWFHIHSLMPICDAARAACLSRSFLCSWRCRPNLTLNRIALYTNSGANTFIWKIDKIIRNHSGIGLKTLDLNLKDEEGTIPYVDSWFQAAVTPGIEVLNLSLYKKYNFPCSLLSDGVRNSIRVLQLDCCVFRPTTELGPLRRLTSLNLSFVRITGDELECLLSNSLALEQLWLYECKEITFLGIPFVLKQLSQLTVSSCIRLQMIECKAPNLSIIDFYGYKIKLSLGQPLQMKKLYMWLANSFCFACSELPSIMPNLEVLEICLDTEAVNTPLLTYKFLYLKNLSIDTWEMTLPVDYLSLVSFFDGSPSLETFSLNVPFGDTKHESLGFGDSSYLRQLPEHRHNCLKIMEITGFNTAKSLVELTCYIVKNAVSLECITLNTLPRHSRCSDRGIETCWPRIGNAVLKEASRAVMVIQMYIEDKVAPTAKLTVVGPCARCHSSG